MLTVHHVLLRRTWWRHTCASTAMACGNAAMISFVFRNFCTSSSHFSMVYVYTDNFMDFWTTWKGCIHYYKINGYDINKIYMFALQDTRFMASVRVSVCLRLTIVIKRHGRCDSNLKGALFRRILWNDILISPCEVNFKSMPDYIFSDKPTLVQVIVWRRETTIHCHFQCRSWSVLMRLLQQGNIYIYIHTLPAKNMEYFSLQRFVAFF